MPLPLPLGCLPSTNPRRASADTEPRDGGRTQEPLRCQLFLVTEQLLCQGDVTTAVWGLPCIRLTAYSASSSWVPTCVPGVGSTGTPLHVGPVNSSSSEVLYLSFTTRAFLSPNKGARCRRSAAVRLALSPPSVTATSLGYTLFSPVRLGRSPLQPKS